MDFDNSNVYTEKDLDNFVNISPNGILVINKEHQIIKCNNIVNNIFGYILPDTLLNKQLEIIIPEQFRDIHNIYISKYFSKPYKRIGRIFNGLKKDLSLIPIEVSLSYVNLETDIFVIAIVREVRELKQLYYFNLILNSVVDGIIIVDRNGIIQIKNNKIDDMFGYNSDELLMNSIDILIPDSHKKYHKTYINDFFEKDRRLPNKPLQAKRKNGELFYIDISLSKTEIDNIPSVILIIRDITHKIKREKELIEAKEEAVKAKEEAVKAKEEAVKAKEEAIIAGKAKTDFLGNMSHEIRTPLNGIIGSIELLQNDNNKEQQDFLNIIKSCSNSLSIIINDLLDFSKIINNQLIIRPYTYDFIKIKKEISDMIQILLKSKQIHIYETSNLDNLDSMYLYLDFQRLKQIIFNLISNAIKFTNENGSIYIDYQITNKKDELTFKIKDTGIGISNEKKHLLFKMFSRVYDGMYQGTGLGLVITKNLVELMGGNLKYESIYGIGTTFIINLPIKNIPIKENSIHSINEIEYKNLNDINILIAEDNIINIKIITKMLEKLDIKKYNLANNGNVAIELTKKKNFDIIFMDVYMPEINGLEATKQIRQYNQTVPIIAMTASIFDNEIKECLDSGMTDRLLKPFTINDLKNVLLRYKPIK